MAFVNEKLTLEQQKEVNSWGIRLSSLFNGADLDQL